MGADDMMALPPETEVLVLSKDGMVTERCRAGQLMRFERVLLGDYVYSRHNQRDPGDVVLRIVGPWTRAKKE